VYRENRFTGCSGLVAHEEGTNDRAPSSYNIQNMQYYSSGDSYQVVNVGTYDPLGSTLFTFEQPFQFPDGTTRVPADTMTTDYDCPFPDGAEETFVEG
jgi:hypothetical protein